MSTIEGVENLAGQRGVEVVGHDEGPSVDTELTRWRVGYGDETGDRNTAADDDHLLALRDTPQQAGQVRLGLVYTHLGHCSEAYQP